MDEVVKVIELTAEVNELLRARSRELDRREKFDQEISKMIHETLDKRKSKRI